MNSEELYMFTTEEEFLSRRIKHYALESMTPNQYGEDLPF